MRKPKVVHFWRGRLPHMQVEDGRYFVTMHLKSAIPQSAQSKIRSTIEEFRKSATINNSELSLTLARKLFGEMERWLDRGQSKADLGNPQVAAMVLDSLEYGQKQKIWNMFNTIIMPNHLHMFFELYNDRSLKRELENFKRWTSHQANQLLGIKNQPFWQTEWFDHWSRSEEQDEKIMRYISNNPKKAGLVGPDQEWPYHYP